MTFGFQLFIVGILQISTPLILGNDGPTDDHFTNLMHKLPLKHIFTLRGMVISGVLFVMTGCTLMVTK